ncbi:MAG: AzlD domain-containing protein [Candidatus Promineifilaceae bacterium]|jgi:branched-subunit amino acid transport protein
MSDWIIILGMGLITHSQRLSMIITSGRLTISEPLRRALRFAPPAVLSAIILPEMLQPGGQLDFSLGNERLLAGLVAILIAWRTKNMVLTVAIGMVTLWILQFINQALFGP